MMYMVDNAPCVGVVSGDTAMTECNEREIVTLIDQWRVRAKNFMAEAEQARRSLEIVRLTALASTLDWAAMDLSCLVRSQETARLLAPLRDKSKSDPGGELA
jgi:hypothetical protein